MIRRYAIGILILHVGNGYSALLPHRPAKEFELLTVTQLNVITILVILQNSQEALPSEVLTDVSAELLSSF